jgi:hypothetical protein
VVYFAGKPFGMTLSADYSTLQFTPREQTAGILSFKKELQELALGWEKAPGRWEVINPKFSDGQVMLPNGNFRLISCSLSGKTTRGTTLKATSATLQDKVFQVPTGQTGLPELGTPLSLELKAEKNIAKTTATPVASPLASLLGRAVKPSGETMLRMDVAILGVGKEKYSSFTESQQAYSKKPRWEIVDAGGKQIANGDFEYG